MEIKLLIKTIILDTTIKLCLIILNCVFMCNIAHYSLTHSPALLSHSITHKYTLTFNYDFTLI